MGPEEEKIVSDWSDSLTGSIEIALLVDENGKEDPELLRFLEGLSRLAPSVSWARDSDHPAFAPGIRVGSNVFYQAAPMDRELPPFLEILGSLGGREMPLAEPAQKLVDAIDLPAHLKVYVTSHCPYCPTVLQRLLAVAGSNERLRLHVIDAERFADQAAEDGVKAVPTILLENQFRWTGQVDVEEVVQAAAHRDPVSLGADSLRNIIEEGDAETLAEMIVEHDEIFPALFDLLVHQRWSVRLGAMVVLESVAEKNPALAQKAAEPIWVRFPDVDDSVKGDLLYMLGEIGDASDLPRLRSAEKALISPDAREAAVEAIEKIADRIR